MSPNKKITKPPARKMPKRKAKRYNSNNITNHNKRFSVRLKNNKNVTTTDISSSNLQIDNQNTSSSSTTLQQISTLTSSLSQPISSPTLKFIFCNGCKKSIPYRNTQLFIQKHSLKNDICRNALFQCRLCPSKHFYSRSDLEAHFRQNVNCQSYYLKSKNKIRKGEFLLAFFFI